ncbi:MAG: glycosyltransferase [Ruminococcus sp.]|nr:glycosyltransferase [Ruminococcus sp.]
MKCSVVIPVYNADKTIEACVNSLLGASDIEIILVNDGSLDNSRNICEKLSAENECVFLINQQNKGVSAARNIGVQNARGEYILFVDADDKVEPGFMNALNCKETPDIIICRYNDIHNMDIKEHLYSREGFSNQNGEIGELLAVCNLAYVWGKFFRKSIIKEHDIIFDTDLCYGEDSLFVLSYCRYIKSCLATNKFVYLYSIDDESSLSRKFVKDLDDAIKKKQEMRKEVFYRFPTYKKRYMQWCPNPNLSAARMRIRNIFRKGSPIKDFNDQCEYVGRIYSDSSTKPYSINYMCNSKIDYIYNLLFILRIPALTVIVCRILFRFK